jgi:hypothetical protein
MSGHNSETPGAISTKLGTHIAICMFYILAYSAGRMVWEAGNLDIHIVEEIKLLLLPGNRLKHIRGNVRYLVTSNIKVSTVEQSTE